MATKDTKDTKGVGNVVAGVGSCGIVMVSAGVGWTCGRCVVRWLVVLFCVVVAGRALRAEGAIAGGDVAVEYSVGEADVVVVGRIVGSREVASPSATVVSSWPWTEFTVQVEEVIAGKAGSQLRFWVDGYAPWAEEKSWWRHPRMLLCLDDGARYRVIRGKRHPIYDSVDLLGREQWSLEGKDPAAIPAARRVPFSSAEDVLAAVRPYGKRPLVMGWAEIDHTEVPVDEREEGYAEEWMQRGTVDDDWAAVSVMIKRKTAASSAALRVLAARESDDADEEVVRAVAASELQARGERVTMGASWRDGWHMLADWCWWAAAAIAAGIVFVARRRAGGGWVWKSVVTVWAGVMGLLVALWLHSYWGGDRISVGHWRVGTIQGRIRMEWVERSDVKAWPTLRYGRPERELDYPNWTRNWEFGMDELKDYWGPASSAEWQWYLILGAPMWAVAGVWALPLAPVLVVAWKRARERRRRGFPVVLAEGAQ